MRIEKNFCLQNYNAYQLVSYCDVAYFPETSEDLQQLYTLPNMESAIVLGNGNNTILAQPRYAHPFVILNECMQNIALQGDLIVADAGATLLQLSEFALQHSFAGAEPFYDIPSSIGGAVVMNAGNKDAEIKDILYKVRYLDLDDLKVKEKPLADIGFSYRNSFFQKNPNNIVLTAWLRLTLGDKDQIKEKMEQGKALRWEKQPREFPNCGSVFKRPQGRFVGPMLDELGLKGFRIGGAEVSKKHSGFIVNVGGATGGDILAVIREVQRRVSEAFGVNLEVEQRIV